MKLEQHVVLRGRCLGHVTAITDEMIVVHELGLRAGEESRFEVPVAGAEAALRPVVSRDEAERVLAMMKTPALEQPRASKADRGIAYRRAVRGGDLAVQARLLAASYAGPTEVPEAQYQEALEAAVFGELAVVLGGSAKQLRARVRMAARKEPAPRSLALVNRSAEVASAKLPRVAGSEPVGAFAIDAKIAVGENRAEVTRVARAGVWLAYAVKVEDDVVELWAVHRDLHANLAELRAESRRIGRAPIEGAMIAIFDEAIADDTEIMGRLHEAMFDIVDHRAAVVCLGGDGVAQVYATTCDKQAVYVRVETD